MDGLKNNGLAKTLKGFENLNTNTSQITSKESHIRKRILSNCRVLKVKGIMSFENNSYRPEDEGGLLVDIGLSEGKTVKAIVEGKMKDVSVIENVRCREDYDILSLRVGSLASDYEGVFGDLEYSEFTYEGIQLSGEFIFKGKNKKADILNPEGRDTRLTLFADKAISHMGALFGNLDKGAATKYKEIAKAEKAKRRRYG